jgi:hypothetical protein
LEALVGLVLIRNWMVVARWDLVVGILRTRRRRVLVADVWLVDVVVLIVTRLIVHPHLYNFVRFIIAFFQKRTYFHFKG